MFGTRKLRPRMGMEVALKQLHTRIRQTSIALVLTLGVTAGSLGGTIAQGDHRDLRADDVCCGIFSEGSGPNGHPNVVFGVQTGGIATSSYLRPSDP